MMQMHGGGAKKGGSGSDKIMNKEPSKRGGAIGGKRGGKASGAPYILPECVLHSHYMLSVCVIPCSTRTCNCSVECHRTSFCCNFITCLVHTIHTFVLQLVACSLHAVCLILTSSFRLFCLPAVDVCSTHVTPPLQWHNGAILVTCSLEAQSFAPYTVFICSLTCVK